MMNAMWRLCGGFGVVIGYLRVGRVCFPPSSTAPPGAGAPIARFAPWPARPTPRGALITAGTSMLPSERVRR
ncbi:hypothetical protein MSM1_03540 [Mycobacterium sp. SM1]|uniref:hypothetical protein n=1 Tax=Mycobacterium sp. SM1 TaxID=2816243 RepID=UPI001BCBA09F|nr:hypothetical protein [Mycobacterium sp. SM1]MBS4727464.1 hypothetical protein [Mycobacterium sp. SM1]